MYRESSPSFNLFCIEIKRHKGDLGISIVLQSTCELMARREVLRLFPEYRHAFPLMEVYLARYAEIDWQSGRSIIAKRERPAEIPARVAAQTKPEGKRPPRLKDEGGVQ